MKHALPQQAGRRRHSRTPNDPPAPMAHRWLAGRAIRVQQGGAAFRSLDANRRALGAGDGIRSFADLPIRGLLGGGREGTGVDPAFEIADSIGKTAGGELDEAWPTAFKAQAL